MEVIVDTCVFMNAVFDQLNHEDCWQILRFIYEKKISPVICVELHREYFCTPQRVVHNEMAGMLKEKKLTPELFEEGTSQLLNYSLSISRIIEHARWVAVKSNLNVCVSHPADDKLVNLAYDSNCNYIITHNIRHLDAVKQKGTKTKSGKPIQVFTPEEFIDHFNNYMRLKQWEDRTRIRI